MLAKILGLAVAGALGTLCRVGLTALVGQWLPRTPWGTVVVNVLGCFLFGLLWASNFGQRAMSVELRLLVFGGFLGAFTTYSTYVFDTVQLSQNLGVRSAAGYFVLQNAAGLAFLFLGLSLGRNA